ncbi:MAG: hypothetical protein Q9227_005924 [Pyrenula ochraceoflavens]
MSSEEDQVDTPISAQSNGTDGDVNSHPGDDGDLFGSDEEQEGPKQKRKLDDPELDSGDDEGRRDRELQEDGDQFDYGEPKRETISSVQLGRIKDPRPSDGELYLLTMPDFMGIESENFDPQTYAIPIQNHGSREGPFSPFDVAASSLFWRHDPSKPRSGRIQSNSRIVRWSDGSLTLQIASSPKDHYRLDSKALRQLPTTANPRKPFPSSLRQKPNTAYDPNKEAHVYLAAPHETAGCFRLVSPVSAALRVLPTGDQSDSAILALQADLKAAGAYEDPVATIKTLRVDPEKAKRDAEAAERQKLAAIRKRENMEFKEATRNTKNYNRIRRSGLTVGGLEGDDDELGMATTRPKKKPKKPRSNRRGEILTDTESEGGYGGGLRGRTREDEYDMDDKFMAPSDEEIPTYEDGEEDAEGEPDEDDPDVDDLEIEGRETVVQEKTRGGAAAAAAVEREITPKRGRNEDEEEGEIGAAGSPHARKKRMVISDDEDE